MYLDGQHKYSEKQVGGVKFGIIEATLAARQAALLQGPYNMELARVLQYVCACMLVLRQNNLLARGGLTSRAGRETG